MTEQTSGPAAQPGTQPTIADVFDQHQYAEFVLHDADKALETMVSEPSVQLMATGAGGDGRDGVRNFYAERFIPKLPPDLEVTPISRTVGLDRLVDEDVLSFTHNIEVPWLLPGLPPTGKKIQLAVVVVVDFEDGKVARERVYWDQASALAQAGVIDAEVLRIVRTEAAERLMRLSTAHA